MKSRTQYEKERKKANENRKRLKSTEELEYYHRLTEEYGEKKLFVAQYVNGDGHELKSHFWSCKSSSRFCFELYSWLAKQPEIKHIEFEKKLKSFKGAKRCPNMDVYIEKQTKVYFIESKLTETKTQTINDLSKSYYEEYADDNKTTLLKRYYEDEDGVKAIQELVKFTKELLDGKGYTSCWMDFKQEICHLIGIYITVSRSNGAYKEKNIEFYNVYYDFGDEVNDAIEPFFEKAREMMDKLLVKRDFCKSFIYDHITAQKFVKTNELFVDLTSETKAFGSTETVEHYLKHYFDFDIK